MISGVKYDSCRFGSTLANDYSWIVFYSPLCIPPIHTEYGESEERSILTLVAKNCNLYTRYTL